MYTKFSQNVSITNRSTCETLTCPEDSLTLIFCISYILTIHKQINGFPKISKPQVIAL